MFQNIFDVFLLKIIEDINLWGPLWLSIVGNIPMFQD